MVLWLFKGCGFYLGCRYEGQLAFRYDLDGEDAGLLRWYDLATGRVLAGIQLDPSQLLAARVELPFELAE